MHDGVYGVWLVMLKNIFTECLAHLLHSFIHPSHRDDLHARIFLPGRVGPENVGLGDAKLGGFF